MRSNYLLSIFLLLPPFFVIPADLSSYDQSVFDAASPPLQRISSMLNDPIERDSYPYSLAIFEGEPGVGKSSLAIATALKAGWEPCVISNAELDSSHRNASSEKLKHIISEVRRSDEKMVLIFEEFNTLVENANDPQYDTGNLSKHLWGFFDELQREKNKRIFCIGTLNNAEDIPKEFKSRLEATTHRVEGIKDPEHVKKILLSNIESPYIELDKPVKEYLLRKFEKEVVPPAFTFARYFSYWASSKIDRRLKSMNNPRSIAMCGMAIKNNAFDYRKERPVHLTNQLIDDGIKRFNEANKILKFNKEVISESERHHQESMYCSNRNTGLGIAATLTATGAGIANSLGYFDRFKAATE